ncbi:signal peptidase II [Parasulfitobacter algicola]|uniref:Lipoprotein signal peptidase n=1 Tax=Parasulfitobacter algicola TaxID=2614809 RepID=A0ABX2IQ81_9RHOB|nr:signal peptidase II [Sulfitobacter algicola]NSX55008.1 signal peptidase II [Sulfitobacter algicola]
MKLVFWTSFWIFLIDQASKYLIVQYLNLKNVGSIDVFPPFLNLRMAWNYGINFGLLGGADAPEFMRWIWVAVALVISALVVFWMKREKPGRWGYISAGLLVGGALGNTIDRIIYGAVADFLNMSCCGLENPYAFNVADISIFAGAIGLILFTGTKKTA